ncbi:LysR family transcriptional regulator [soil metagenome]
MEERFDALLFDRRRCRLQLTRRVKQVASGWEDRLWLVTDELIEVETLLPLIAAFDALGSGVPLRLTHEVLRGTWEALAEGRADLVIGATNEPPAIEGLRWFELGVVEWVFAVAPQQPLAAAAEPLPREAIARHRAEVVADSSRQVASRAYGVQGGQPPLALPSMRAKIMAQRDGLGVGWLPRQRVASLLARGELIEKQTADPREPNVLYVAWRGEQTGRALDWWLDQFRQARLAEVLVRGRDGFAG